MYGSLDFFVVLVFFIDLRIIIQKPKPHPEDSDDAGAREGPGIHTGSRGSQANKAVLREP